MSFTSFFMLQQFVTLPRDGADNPVPTKEPLSIKLRRVKLHRALLALSFTLLAACGSGGGGDGGGDASSGHFNSTGIASTTDPIEPRPSNYCPAGQFLAQQGRCYTNSQLARLASTLTNVVRGSFNERVNGDWRHEKQFERAQSWPYEMTNWHEAIANLALVRGDDDASRPGKGVTIGLIDNGVDVSHSVFTSRPENDRRSISNTITEEGATQNNHGTAVAGIAAGEYGAYGANIKSYAIRLGDGSGPYRPVTLQQLNAVDYGNSVFLREVLDDGIDILNLSFGFNGGIEDYSEQDLRHNFSRTIRAASQSEKIQNKTILVFSAGNAGLRPSPAKSSSPEIYSGMIARIDELQGHSIAVVSVGEDGDISNFSNRCGIARNFCIAAPGEWVLVARPDDRFSIGSGTSFAAPMVSGGLAIMKHLFRGQLTNEQLVSRLFTTANDDGIYGNSSIYGHGLMDLGAATNPWGITGFMGTGQSTSNDITNSLSSTFLSAGNALGDAFSLALDSKEVATFDSLGAPFWFDAGQLTIDAPGTTIAASLQSFMNPINQEPVSEKWQFTMNNLPKLGHMALVPNHEKHFNVAGPRGFSASMFQQGIELSWNPSAVPFSFSAGHLKENDSLLGSQANGAFGHLSAETTYLSTGWNANMGQWSLAAVGEIGQVNPSVTSSDLIDTISPLRTSAFRLQASREFNHGNTLRFSLSQPLRVDHGSMVLTLPSGVKDGVVTGSSQSAGLTPSGRQLDLTAALSVPVGVGDLSLGLTMRTEPGHQQGTGADYGVFTAYRGTW